MNLNHLAIFHAVAEAGSVTRAAERLCISQPAVSKQLRELERSLGMALFHRLSKGIQLTEAGQLLRSYSGQLFALETEAEQALRELRALQRGSIRVGASSTIGIYLLPEICSEFQQQYPGIEINLEIGNTAQVERWLRENIIDVALTEGLQPAPDLQAEIFMMDEMVVVAATNHPLLQQVTLTAAQICDEPFVLREAGSGTRAVIEHALEAVGLHIHPIMSLGSTEAIKRSVAAGTGLSIVSRLTISVELEMGRLAVLPVSDLRLQRPLYRLRLPGKYEGRATREFVRLLRQAMAEYGAGGQTQDTSPNGT